MQASGLCYSLDQPEPDPKPRKGFRPRKTTAVLGRLSRKEHTAWSIAAVISEFDDDLGV